MKYIDAEKLKAEIERRKLLLTQYSKLTYDLILETFIKEYDDLLSFIGTLQQEQPEVDLDLDADIEMEWDSFNKHIVKYDERTEGVVWLNWFSFVDIANYFWNKGYNARKED